MRRVFNSNSFYNIYQHTHLNTYHFSHHHYKVTHVRSMSIDVHTHMYTPKYMDILQKRIDIPRVIMINNQARLVILPGEDKEITTSIGMIISLFGSK